jgi:D-alanyl-D-alanine carboxypeptidase (penicillin-binding protein 5/6)
MFSRILSFVICIFVFSVAEARPSTKKSFVAKPIQASLVIDAKSNKVLHSNNSKKLIYPASLTKLMTVYLAFDAIEKGHIAHDDIIVVSEHAASARPCKLGLNAGDEIKFSKAIIASIVKSANDATRALAEKIAGSENRFADLMNKTAKKLGMRNTNFTNSTGWPDSRQQTTVEDLSKLAIALKKHFPKYYVLFRQTSFTYNGKTYQGHNHVTKNYAGAEGLKTGYIAASGFNLVTSATRGEKSLIGVVIGGASARARDAKMMALLDQHFGSKKLAKSSSTNVKKLQVASLKKSKSSRNLSQAQSTTKSKLKRG